MIALNHKNINKKIYLFNFIVGKLHFVEKINRGYNIKYYSSNLTV